MTTNKLEQAARQSFETWWESEGQEFLYALNTTTDDDIKLVAEIAWKNGAYCAEQAEQEPPKNQYNHKRIGWELERTAQGESYYGNALYVAMDLPFLNKREKDCLHRYMHGSELANDRFVLQDIAMKVYSEPESDSRPVRTKDLTDDEIADIVYEMNGNEPTAPFWLDLARAFIQEFRRKNGIV